MTPAVRFPVVSHVSSGSALDAVPIASCALSEFTACPKSDQSALPILPIWYQELAISAVWLSGKAAGSTALTGIVFTGRGVYCGVNPLPPETTLISRACSASTLPA